MKKFSEEIYGQQNNKYILYLNFEQERIDFKAFN